MNFVCGGTNSIDRNFLNIDPNDLIFFLKDRQLNVDTANWTSVFVYDQPLMRYLQLKLPFLSHVIQSDKF